MQIILPLGLATIIAFWGAQAGPGGQAQGNATAREAPSLLESDPEIASLFKADPATELVRIPAGLAAAGVCASPQALQSLYAGRGVQAITWSVPFSPVRKPNDVCHVRITSSPQAGRDLFKSRSCSVRVVNDGKIDILVAPGTTEEFAAAECFYRLALVLEGFPGGFKAPIFGTYSNSFYFIGKRNFVGPIVSPAVAHLLRDCAGIVDHYYTRTVAAFVRTRCRSVQ
jgi:hypothetical protein